MADRLTVTDLDFDTIKQNLKTFLNQVYLHYLYQLICIVPLIEGMKQFTSIDTDNGGTLDLKKFLDYATKYPNQILSDGEINDMFEKINKVKTGVMTIDKLCK
jgi:hypothetical protein